MIHTEKSLFRSQVTRDEGLILVGESPCSPGSLGKYVRTVLRVLSSKVEVLRSNAMTPEGLRGVTQANHLPHLLSMVRDREKGLLAYIPQSSPIHSRSAVQLLGGHEIGGMGKEIPISNTRRFLKSVLWLRHFHNPNVLEKFRQRLIFTPGSLRNGFRENNSSASFATSEVPSDSLPTPLQVLEIHITGTHFQTNNETSVTFFISQEGDWYEEVTQDGAQNQMLYLRPIQFENFRTIFGDERLVDEKGGGVGDGK